MTNYSRVWIDGVEQLDQSNPPPPIVATITGEVKDRVVSAIESGSDNWTIATTITDSDGRMLSEDQVIEIRSEWEADNAINVVPPGLPE